LTNGHSVIAFGQTKDLRESAREASSYFFLLESAMSDRSGRAAEIATGLKARADAKLGDVWWTILSRGVLALGLAVCAFVWPEQTLEILIKLLGAYFLVDGAISAFGAYRGGDRGASLMQAVVGVAIGLVLLLWTDVSAKLFMIFVGIWLVLQGIGLFLSSRNIDAAEGERGLTGIIGGIMAVIGLVFVFWTDTGVVAISWLIGIGALIIGCLLIFLATRVKRLRTRVAGAGGRL
jgi:uncharacterized membrane protein HdeD (DUF308 family)